MCRKTFISTITVRAASYFCHLASCDSSPSLSPAGQMASASKHLRKIRIKSDVWSGGRVSHQTNCHTNAGMPCDLGLDASDVGVPTNIVKVPCVLSGGGADLMPPNVETKPMTFCCTS